VVVAAPWDDVRTFVQHTRDEWRSRQRASLHRPALRALAHTVYRRGLLNTNRGLRATIERCLHPERLAAARARIWIAVCEHRGWVPWRGETKYVDLKRLPLERMRAVLLASASPPVLFPAVRHGQQLDERRRLEQRPATCAGV